MKKLLILLLLTLTTPLFSQPIIGGRLKSTVLKTPDMYVVNSGAELVQALQLKKRKIFINTNIDLSNFKNILIGDSTTILSYSRTVTHSKWFTGGKDTGFVFLTGGSNITILGTRFVGVSGEIRSYEKSAGYQGLIRVIHPKFYMNNCSVENFPTWGLFLQCSSEAVISECRFKGCQDAGYGYGIWIGGCGNNSFSHYISYCEFTKCRHGVASSGHPTAWYLSNCAFYGNFQNYQLDRHNLYTECQGGDSTVISNNYFLVPSEHYGLEFPVTSNGAILITNNYFAQDSLTSGSICSYKWYQVDTPTVKIYNNKFNTIFIKPEIGFTADSLYVIGNFNRYEWLSDNKVYTTKYIPRPLTTSITQVRVWDYSGVPSQLASTEKINDSNANDLIFMYKDTYIGVLRKLSLQVLDNRTAIYKQDLGGNSSTWNRIPLSLLNVPSGDTLRIRILVTDTISGLGTQFFIDNIFYKGSFITMENGYAPFKITYNPLIPGAASISVGTALEGYTGMKSICITFSNGKKYIPGQYVELWVKKT